MKLPVQGPEASLPIPFFASETVTLYNGDCRAILASLPEKSVNCCITSPPYWGLRDYGVTGQIGLEDTPDAYVAQLVDVFREVRRVLRDDGTLWLNLGDSYAADRSGTTPPAQTIAGGINGKGGVKERRGQAAGYNATRNCRQYGLKHKDLVGIPWRVAFALQADGWYLRSDIIWHKVNPMPESVTDRPTKAHEYLFLLAKSEKYWYDLEASKEAAVGKPSGNKSKGEKKRNRRTVWTIATRPFKGAHFATFPPDLIRPCILAGCPAGGTVLDPFNGAGTTGLVALENGRHYIGCELNPEYCQMTVDRLAQCVLPLEVPA